MPKAIFSRIDRRVLVLSEAGASEGDVWEFIWGRKEEERIWRDGGLAVRISAWRTPGTAALHFILLSSSHCFRGDWLSLKQLACIAHIVAQDKASDGIYACFAA